MAQRRPNSACLRALAAIALLATIASACSHDDGPRVHVPRGATVLLVGDSLLWESQPVVERTVRAAGWKPVVDGRPGSGLVSGFTMPNWPARIQQLVQQSHPTVAVVELGTNGCRGCPSVGAAIDADMRPLRHLRRVYWVNVKTYSNIPPHPKAINKAIENAKKRWPQLKVIDMNGRFEHHRELLAPDGTHFSPAGRVAFADMLVHALQRG